MSAADAIRDSRGYREAWNAIRENQDTLLEGLLEKNTALIQELESKERRLKENQYIALLIDGEALQFTEELLSRPGGGALAAGDLIHEARKLANAKYGGSERGLQYLPVHAYIFGDIESAKMRGNIPPSSMRSFMGSFTRHDDMVNYVELGPGEVDNEIADAKIESLARFHVQNPNCVQLILGINQRNERTINFIGSSSLTRSKETVQRISLILEKSSGLDHLPYERAQVSQRLFRNVGKTSAARESAATVESRKDPKTPKSVLREITRVSVGRPASESPGSPSSELRRPLVERPPFASVPNQTQRDAASEADQDAQDDPSYDVYENFECREGESPPPTPLLQPKKKLRRHPPVLQKPPQYKFDRFLTLHPKPCKEHHLSSGNGCQKMHACNYSHDHVLDENQLEVLRWSAQLTRCRFGENCKRTNCYNGHFCGNVVVQIVRETKTYACKRHRCPFSEREHPPGCIIPSPGPWGDEWVRKRLDLGEIGDGQQGGGEGEEGDNEQRYKIPGRRQGMGTSDCVSTDMEEKDAAAEQGWGQKPEWKHIDDDVDKKVRRAPHVESDSEDDDADSEDDSGWGYKKAKIKIPRSGARVIPDWESIPDETLPAMLSTMLRASRKGRTTGGNESGEVTHQESEGERNASTDGQIQRNEDKSRSTSQSGTTKPGKGKNARANTEHGVFDVLENSEEKLSTRSRQPLDGELIHW